jgi:hypothetical protein
MANSKTRRSLLPIPLDALIIDASGTACCVAARP